MEDSNDHSTVSREPIPANKFLLQLTVNFELYFGSFDLQKRNSLISIWKSIHSLQTGTTYQYLRGRELPIYLLL